MAEEEVDNREKGFIYGENNNQSQHIIPWGVTYPTC